jgi:hypothetical protein
MRPYTLTPPTHTQAAHHHPHTYRGQQAAQQRHTQHNHPPHQVQGDGSPLNSGTTTPPHKGRGGAHFSVRNAPSHTTDHHTTPTPHHGTKTGGSEACDDRTRCSHPLSSSQTPTHHHRTHPRPPHPTRHTPHHHHRHTPPHNNDNTNSSDTTTGSTNQSRQSANHGNPGTRDNHPTTPATPPHPPTQPAPQPEQ